MRERSRPVWALSGRFCRRPAGVTIQNHERASAQRGLRAAGGGRVSEPLREARAVGARDGSIDDLRYREIGHELVSVRVGRERREKREGPRLGQPRRLVLQVVDDEGVGREGAQPLLLRVDDGRETLGRRAELRRREPVEAEVGPR
jgi:hypothetical protein